MKNPIKIIRSKFLYRFKEKNFYSKLVGKGQLCFDIGANVGKKSRLLLKTGAQVVAFEPQSSCFKALSKIKNPNFSHYPFAAGSKNETRELHLSNHSEVATLSDEFIKKYTTDAVFWQEKEPVMVRTLDALIAEFGLPYFCKIDVEGYELEVLSQLSQAIPLIEFEFTEQFLEDTLKIIDGFANDKMVYNYTLNEHLKFQLRAWVPASEIKEILIGLKAKNLHGNLFCKANA